MGSFCEAVSLLFPLKCPNNLLLLTFRQVVVSGYFLSFVSLILLCSPINLPPAFKAALPAFCKVCLLFGNGSVYKKATQFNGSP